MARRRNRSHPDQSFFDFIADRLQDATVPSPSSPGPPPRKYFVYGPTFRWRTAIPSVLISLLPLLRLLPDTRGSTIVFVGGVIILALSLLPFMLAVEMAVSRINCRKQILQTVSWQKAYSLQAGLIAMCVVLGGGLMYGAFRVAGPEFRYTYDATKDAISDAVEYYHWREGTETTPGDGIGPRT